MSNTGRDSGTDGVEVCNGVDDNNDPQGLVDEPDPNDPARGPCGGTYPNGCPIGHIECSHGMLTACLPSEVGENCPIEDRVTPDNPLVDSGTTTPPTDSGTTDPPPDPDPSAACITTANAECPDAINPTEVTCACIIDHYLKCMGYSTGWGGVCLCDTENSYCHCAPAQDGCDSGYLTLREGGMKQPAGPDDPACGDNVCCFKPPFDLPVDNNNPPGNMCN
ncbi:MAG: hypothetical protein IPJ88_08810 [Myxococcales bacterium]|nr:MAG: hypothetical protein IPJ88_08810 [Myxococcales bacterium]